MSLLMMRVVLMATLTLVIYNSESTSEDVVEKDSWSWDGVDCMQSVHTLIHIQVLARIYTHVNLTIIIRQHHRIATVCDSYD